MTKSIGLAYRGKAIEKIDMCYFTIFLYLTTSKYKLTGAKYSEGQFNVGSLYLEGLNFGILRHQVKAL